ncbi:hypothetical protein PIB30_018802 [Stylosanthes scabra]|uniref:RNase H type-1 domain-containing protein n=1 Tax=Stylosanthes scabra TaxID=79078 RepID=A0ABU6S7J3_9FABA|nr:hypothetical protein [Stylosanthes scabra]
MEEPLENLSAPKNHQFCLEISQQFPTNTEQSTKEGSKLYFNLPEITEAATELNLKDWIVGMMEKTSRDGGGLFLYCLQNLWCGRNLLVFQREASEPEQLVDRALRDFSEFSTASIRNRTVPQQPSPGSDSNSHWSPLPPGTFKLNFDAACNYDGRRGVGVVIRNEDGVVNAAATMEVQENLSVKEAEAMGAFMGLEFAL